MADYATLAEVQAGFPDSTLATTTDTGFTGLIASMITRASRLIDNEVGMWPNYFEPTTDGETRLFDGSGENANGSQPIDDCISLTSVSVAESGGVASSDYTTWTEDTDFFVAPYNYVALSQPITDLIIQRDGGKGSWLRARKSIKVTGLFGYALTRPEEINQACIIQAVRWYMRSKQSYEDASANPFTGELLFLQELDPDIKLILRKYQIRNMV